MDKIPGIETADIGATSPSAYKEMVASKAEAEEATTITPEDMSQREREFYEANVTSFNTSFDDYIRERHKNDIGGDESKHIMEVDSFFSRIEAPTRARVCKDFGQNRDVSGIFTAVDYNFEGESNTVKELLLSLQEALLNDDPETEIITITNKLKEYGSV